MIFVLMKMAFWGPNFVVRQLRSRLEDKLADYKFSDIKKVVDSPVALLFPWRSSGEEGRL